MQRDGELVDGLEMAKATHGFAIVIDGAGHIITLPADVPESEQSQALGGGITPFGRGSSSALKAALGRGHAAAHSGAGAHCRARGSLRPGDGAQGA